jgi:hypothetical protein
MKSKQDNDFLFIFLISLIISVHIFFLEKFKNKVCWKGINIKKEAK